MITYATRSVRILTLVPALFAAVSRLPAQAILVTNSDQTSSATQYVEKFTLEGVASTFAAPPGIGNPYGITFDAEGNLYVVNSAGYNTIRKYSPTGQDLGNFVSTNIDSPQGIAFDRVGNLYVASNNSSAILKFFPDGTPAPAPFASTRYPAGIAFDGSGNLYAVNSAGGDNTIHRFGPNGEDQGVFADSHLNDPIALAFDVDGYLYVTNSADNTVTRFAPNGAADPDPFLHTGLNIPIGIAIDAVHGFIYVVNQGDNTIHKFSTAGVDLDVFASGLTHPTYIAVQPIVEQIATPAGTGVTVSFTQAEVPISMTFSSVNQPGTTTVAAGPSGPNAPSGFQLNNESIYYHLSTSAQYSGTIAIGITYPANFAGTPKLMHFESNAWHDVTTSVDTTNHIVTGAVTSLSPFGLFSPGQYTAAVQSPISANGSSVFKKNRGTIPVKFTLTAGGRRVSPLPTAFISLYRVTGNARQRVPLASYLAPSDSGRFKIEGGSQYGYNLDPRGLGAGTYVALILIKGEAVGSATFVVN